MSASETPQRVPAAFVIAEAARQIGVTAADLTGTARHKEIVHARQRAMWAIKRLHPSLSLSAVARPFQKDHTTVHAACRRVEERRGTSGRECALGDMLLEVCRERAADRAPVLSASETAIYEAMRADKALREAAFAAGVALAGNLPEFTRMMERIGSALQRQPEGPIS